MSAPGTTQGPWTATERAGYHEILAPSQDADWYGRPRMHAVAYLDTEIDDGEQIANAHQIAASGDLYDALEGAIAAWDLLYPSFPVSPAFEDAEFAEMQAARAALRKARGEA